MPPATVSAKALSAAQAEVRWQAAATATSYEVRRATTSGGPYAVVGTATTTSYVDKTVSPATTYHYVVRSRYGKRVSGDSDQASVLTPLQKPVNVRATGAETSMELSWTAVPDASRYEVIRLSNDAPVETVVGSTTATGYLDTGLTVGSMAVGDVTGDGRNDVVVTVSGNAPNAQVQVLTHGTDGALGRWIRYAVYEVPDAIAIADVNNDGLNDLLMANYNYGLVVAPQQPAATDARVQVAPA